jgi:protein TonB
VYRCGCGVVPPRLVQNQEPEYSERARKKKISGTVVLSIIIDSAGNVRDAKVKRSLEPTLDQQAIAAVDRWQFQPATKGGEPVAVEMEVETSFRIYR